MYIILSETRIEKKYLQRSGVTGGTVTFARNVMAPTAVSTTAFLGTILSISVRRTLLIAIHAGPTSRAYALAIERITRGPVLALAIYLAISAPFTQRAFCSYGKVKNKSPRVYTARTNFSASLAYKIARYSLFGSLLK